MSLDPEFAAEVSRISGLVQRFLREESLSIAKPKDVMRYLIDHGVFGTDYREGNPLRKILRRLDAEGRLDLIEGLRVDRRGAKRFWYLTRI